MAFPGKHPPPKQKVFKFTAGGGIVTSYIGRGSKQVVFPVKDGLHLMQVRSLMARKYPLHNCRLFYLPGGRIIARIRVK